MAEQFDLQKEFDDANTKYFSGKLKPVKLKWHTSQSRLGYVKATIIKQSLTKFIVEDIKELSMNKAIDFDREAFLRTFLHELCHLFMLQNYAQFNWYGGYHGHAWKEFAGVIGRMAGISRVNVEIETGILPSKSKYIKEYYIVLYPDLMFGKIDPKLIEKSKTDPEALKFQLGRLFNINNAEVYKTKIDQFTRIPIRRSTIKKFKFIDNALNKQIADDLRSGKDGSERIL